MSYVKLAVPRITLPLRSGQWARFLAGGMRLLAIAFTGATLLDWDEAHATALQFRIDGTVGTLQMSSDGGHGSYVPQGLAAGQAFSATISYEMAPPTGIRSYDAYSGNAWYRYTAQNGLQGAVHFDFGNGFYADGFVEVVKVHDGNPASTADQINDDYLSLSLTIVSQNILQAPPSGQYQLSDTSGYVGIHDVDRHAFDGGDLPNATLDGGAFESMNANISWLSEYYSWYPCNSIEGYCEDQASASAYLPMYPTSISAVVPLPGTAWLLGGAFSLLCAAGQRVKPPSL